MLKQQNTKGKHNSLLLTEKNNTVTLIGIILLYLYSVLFLYLFIQFLECLLYLKIKHCLYIMCSCWCKPGASMSGPPPSRGQKALDIRDAIHSAVHTLYSSFPCPPLLLT